MRGSEPAFWRMRLQALAATPGFLVECGHWTLGAHPRDLMATSADALPQQGSFAPKVSAGWALALLVFINLFNYIDRQVLAAVEPEIRKELLTDAQGIETDDAKYWTGWLATAFLLSYM